MEDIDTVRCHPRFEAEIVRDLEWLGLRWDGPILRQSERLAAYAAALEHLSALGVLYRCFRTRKSVMDEIARAPHDASPPLRPGPHPPEDEARHLAEGAPFAWRMSIDAALAILGDRELFFLEVGEGPNGETGLIAAQPALAGDVILARKALGVSYHLAVVVDDAEQRVTEVVRGWDLFAAAHIQRLLQALLDLPTPSYRHHRLILRPDGKRFAKRDQDETLAGLRERGVSPEDLRASLGFTPAAPQCSPADPS
jgi:glutamyl-Q tRNA(Asp) synthetase